MKQPGTGTNSDNDKTEQGFGEGQQAAVEQMVNTAVNGALTQHLTRFKKQFTDDIMKTLNETLAPVGEQLKTFAGQIQQGEAAPTKKGAGGTQLPPEFEQELARARGQVEELRAEVDKQRKAREEERAQMESARAEAARREERDQLGQLLRARGVAEVQARAAVALLHNEDAKVGRSEDGNIIFKVQKGSGAGKYVDEIPLAVGVEEWLKSDEGKSFLPARQAGGAGGLVARPATTGDAKRDNRSAAAADLAKALLGG